MYDSVTNEKRTPLSNKDSLTSRILHLCSASKLKLTSTLDLCTRETLDELNDKQFLKFIDEVEVQLKRMKAENLVFKHFLKKNSPSMFSKFDSYVSQVTSHDVDHTVERAPTDLDILQGKRVETNYFFRLDLVHLFVEDFQVEHEIFFKKNRIEIRRINANLEEIDNQVEEIKEVKETFDHHMTGEGCKMTRWKPSAETFIKFMNNFVKYCMRLQEKLRLRTTALKAEYKKVSLKLVEYRELSKNVHTIDFERLRMENKTYAEKIENQRNQLLILKKTTGNACYMLHQLKKKCQIQTLEVDSLKKAIKNERNVLENIEKECVFAQEDCAISKYKFQKLQEFNAMHKVPDVLDYLEVKMQLDFYEKAVLMEKRKNSVLNISLNSSIKQMMNMTGSNFTTDWLEDPENKLQVIQTIGKQVENRIRRKSVMEIRRLNSKMSL